jgi:hypothetical protein
MDLNISYDSYKMPSWVAGHISGGLGNRLFQHASALGLAEKWGKETVFYLPRVQPTNHGPFENLFKLFPTTRVITEEEPNLMLPEPNGNVFTYTPFQEDPIASNVVVDGWRQTAKYFPVKGVQVELESSIPEARRLELLQKYDLEAKKDSTCFLHFRFGDYKILRHHQINVGAYVSNASKQFPKQTRFLVFSDEAKQYKSMLEEFVLAVGHEPIVVEEEDELENMYLMSQCGGGAIVCNSTFSWWGAYFARQRCSNPALFKACYPEVWGDGLPPARDVNPPWGIAIKFE